RCARRAGDPSPAAYVADGIRARVPDSAGDDQKLGARAAAAGRAGCSLFAGDCQTAPRSAGGARAVTRAIRTMIPAEESFAAWRKNPNYVKAYDALEAEFS